MNIKITDPPFKILELTHAKFVWVFGKCQSERLNAKCIHQLVFIVLLPLLFYRIFGVPCISFDFVFASFHSGLLRPKPSQKHFEKFVALCVALRPMYKHLSAQSKVDFWCETLDFWKKVFVLSWWLQNRCQLCCLFNSGWSKCLVWEEVTSDGKHGKLYIAHVSLH